MALEFVYVSRLGVCEIVQEMYKLYLEEEGLKE